MVVSQRILLGLVVGMAASAVLAQAQGMLRWRAGTPLGLQPSAAAPYLHCGPTSLSCNAGASVPLYTSEAAPRSVTMQVGSFDTGTSLKLDRPQGLSVNLVGKAGIVSDLGVYGRVGTTLARGTGFGPQGVVDGVNYGVGVSWDFSRRGSAVLGFDSYDVRTATGELRDVRATSLGLQWRY